MMKRQMRIVAALIILVAISSNMEKVVGPGPDDCYDACSTACVQPGHPRETARCDRKCGIKCSPDPPRETGA